VLRPLLHIAKDVWATQTVANVRALPAADLARACRRLGANPRITPDPSAALLEATGASDGVVCVTGSLMLVGQARAALGLPAPEQLW
jgi:folylpolyglutamate synthase/dihydropteroate synthase